MLAKRSVVMSRFTTHDSFLCRQKPDSARKNPHINGHCDPSITMRILIISDNWPSDFYLACGLPLILVGYLKTKSQEGRDNNVKLVYHILGNRTHRGNSRVLRFGWRGNADRLDSFCRIHSAIHRQSVNGSRQDRFKVRPRNTLTGITTQFNYYSVLGETGGGICSCEKSF